ncbi:hypothetical protein NO2_0193 [Candidatus Termititenax persephonae]|uniref:Alpha-2-macroglobulin domain-containing protein n=1 Tax=Candidatus Termititenax persephonae TaxID=2218525 RepID=A0A388TFK9_9BACT|nr:hypothetical protein NO2_0193 [Candidatus Termititenax persephonae]
MRKKSTKTKQPAKNKRKLGAVILGGVVLAAAVFLVYHWSGQSIPTPAETSAAVHLKRTTKILAVNDTLSNLTSNYKYPQPVEVKTVKIPYRLGGVKITSINPNGFLFTDTLAFVFARDIFAAGEEVSAEKLISLPGLDGAERRLNANTVKYFIETDLKYGQTYQGRLTYGGQSLDFSFVKPLVIGAYYQTIEQKPHFIVNVFLGDQGQDESKHPRFEEIKEILAEQLYLEAVKDNKTVRSSVTVEKYNSGRYLIKPSLAFSKNVALTLKSFENGIVKNRSGAALAVENGYIAQDFTLESISSANRILAAIDFNFSKRVTWPEFIRHLKITPWPTGLNLEKLYADDYYYSRYGSTTMTLPTDLFQQGVTYNFLVSAALENTDAEKLNEEIEFALVLAEAAPLLELETGINVVEADFPYYSFKSRNIHAVNVAVFEADKNKIVEALQSNLFSSTAKEAQPQAKLSKLGKLTGNYRVTGNRDNYLWYHKIDLARPGIYFAALTPSPEDLARLGRMSPRAQSTIINVTNLGLVVKKSLQNIAVWTTELSSGQPAADVVLAFYDRRGKKIASAQTNADGYCAIPLAIAKLKADIYIIASKGDDTAILATTASQFDSNLEAWEFGINQVDFDTFLAGDNKRYFVVSDSPIYKPGAEINYKLYVREYNENNLAYSRGQATVEIRDAQWDIAYKKELQLKDASSAADSFRLKSNGKLGEYTIGIRTQDDYFLRVGSFVVADYRAPKTKFRVKPERSFTYPNAVETVAISADYYSGQPIKNAPITLASKYHNGSYYYGEWDSPYNNYTFYQPDYFTSLTRQESLSSGSTGRTVWRQNILNQQLKHPIALSLEFTLQDGGLNEKISQYLDYTIYPAEFKIGIKQKGFSNKINEVNEFDFITLSHDDKLVSEQITYAIFLDKIYTVREKGVGNSFEYLNSITPEKVAEGVLTTSLRDSVTLKKSLARAGHYYILARGVDRSGRVTTTKLDFYVNSGDYNWGRYNHDRIDILTDKKTYAPGDDLKILIKSPYRTATGLVTIETNSLKEYQLIEIDNNAPLITWKVKEEYYPNCYISVCLVQGRVGQPIKVAENGQQQIDLGKPSFKIGYQQIKVTKKERDIQVQVQAEKREYSPGDKVNVKVNFSNTKYAQPTNYCVLVVNNALFDLASLRTNIGEVMNPDIPLLVKNYTTYNRLVGRRLFGKKGAVAGGGGGLLDESGQMRKEFKDIIYFAPYLKSTAEQTGSFSFTLPDNAGEFKVLVFADQGPDMFGQGQLILKSSQALLIENALPNFLRSADKTRSGVLVFNNTNVAQSASLEARWSLDETALDRTTQDFTLADQQRLDFDISIPEFYQEAAKTLNVLVAAQTKQNQDRVKFSLPVYRNTVQKVTALNKLILTNQDGVFSGTANLRLTEPPENLLENLSQVKVSFDRDLAALLKAPAEYLIYYPHACWEQKLGMLIGNAAISKSPESSAAQKKVAQKNIDLILAEHNKYQAGNGLYGYWPGGLSHSHYLSIYTLSALNYAKSLGLAIDENMRQELVKTLRKALVQDNPDAYRAKPVRHYLLYELSRAGTDVLPFLEQRDANLTIEDKLYRLFLLHKYNVFPQELASLKQEVIANIYIDQSDRAALKPAQFALWQHATPVKLTALALRLLADIPDMEPYTLRLLNYLLQEKRHDNRWYNTHDNAQVIMSIHNIGDKYFSGNLNGVLTVAGEEVYSGRVDSKTKPIKLASAKLTGEKTITAAITVQGSASAAAFYKLEVTQHLKQLAQHDDKSFKVRTEYFDLNRRRVNSFKKGESYIVRINFSSYEDNTFVVCSDELPAALLPVDFNQLNTSSVLADSLKMNVRPSYQEVRQNRVSYYFDTLPRGNYYVEYAAQAGAAGDYFDPGALAENMYAPDVRGTEKASRIICD